MGYLGPVDPRLDPTLPDRTITPFALSLCGHAEQAFIKACDNLIAGSEERARRGFTSCTRSDPLWLDPWFMIGFIDLVNGRAERARQAFFRILRDEHAFEGIYICRFMPSFRAHANLFEDFLFRVMPTTADVAAITARLYLIEGKNREAKKIIHPAYRQYWEDPAVQAVWAQSMLMDESPEQVVNELDRKFSYHKGNTDLDLLVVHLCGQAYFDLGDFRSGISHWEGALHRAMGKNPRLIDRFKILIANAYEHKGYLIDALEVLSTVEDGMMTYEPGVSAALKREELLDTLDKYKTEGIIKCLRFHEEHEYPRWRPAQGFLEIQRPGGAPA